MNEKEKWAACLANDATYDSVFYLAVKSTGIYCRPSCRARIPLRKNVEFYDTQEDCVKHGYRACKRCRPDLITYQPQKDEAAKIKQIIDVNFDNYEILKSEMKQLSGSRNHQALLFQKEYHQSPSEYRRSLQVEKATLLLRETTRPILEVAYASGFESLATFYKVFKHKKNQTPREFRKGM